MSGIKSFFGNIVLDKIDNRGVEKYKSKRLSDGLQSVTINRELTVLRYRIKLLNGIIHNVRTYPAFRIRINYKNYRSLPATNV